jgi:hypothetical protein
MAPPLTFTSSQLAAKVVNTTLPILARNVPSNDTSRTDADMSAHDRAIKLRNLTIGWYVGLPHFLPSLLSIYPFIPSTPRPSSRSSGSSSSLPNPHH